ncbi:winged helix-turn-helix transcriptional regulator [Saccharopolyspora erythraea]|uniref:GntR family transcriptional regulator n=1 Tax=Saccharopolyspora erythraea TaxID=1836 RepID=UPI001BA7E00F|nr:winged helix-turn-helix domain-containing protein [Saccharopolyspora erythraea]QUG99805.1 winged helix-turn-helix transcriptional regulator [Saccharopolyspora erythraea]
MEQSNLGLAAYQRVVESIKHEIRTGSLAPGERLPGNRAVAEQYDVALGTAQKALRALQDQGWLTSTPSVGVFVSNEVPSEEDGVDVPKVLAALKSELAELAKRVEDLERRS